MRFLTSSGCSRTSKPATVAVPEVGGRKQVSILMVVVLPAPFGPRKPTIWPFSTSNEMWSTAVFRAYLFVSSLTLIIRFVFLVVRCPVLNVPQVAGIIFERFENNILKTREASCQPLKLNLLSGSSKERKPEN